MSIETVQATLGVVFLAVLALAGEVTVSRVRDR